MGIGVSTLENDYSLETVRYSLKLLPRKCTVKKHWLLYREYLASLDDEH